MLCEGRAMCGFEGRKAEALPLADETPLCDAGVPPLPDLRAL